MEFKGKGVLITGGSSGIGLSAAIKFAKDGAQVAILSRNQEKLDYAVQEIIKLAPSSNPLSITCDTRNENGIQNAFDRVVNQFGRLDIVVNTCRSQEVLQASKNYFP